MANGEWRMANAMALHTNAPSPSARRGRYGNVAMWPVGDGSAYLAERAVAEHAEPIVRLEGTDALLLGRLEQVAVCHGMSWYVMVCHARPPRAGRGMAWYVMVCHGTSWYAASSKSRTMHAIHHKNARDICIDVAFPSSLSRRLLARHCVVLRRCVHCTGFLPRRL